MFHDVKLAFHLGKRRVIGDEVVVAIGHSCTRLGEEIARPVDELRVDTRVFQANLHVVAADSACIHSQPTDSRELLKVDIPQPGHVVSVGLLVVDEERDCRGLPILLDDAQILVEARRVLRQVQQYAMPVDYVGLQAAVMGVESLDGRLNRSGSKPAYACRRMHRQSVVHHVRAG